MKQLGGSAQRNDRARRRNKDALSRENVVFILSSMIPETLPVPSAQRVVTPRRYLMCPPDHFEVTYAINPWMNPETPVDASLAARQWETLRDAYLDLGHQVETIKPIEGLPDMVFAAN